MPQLLLRFISCVWLLVLLTGCNKNYRRTFMFQPVDSKFHLDSTQLKQNMAQAPPRYLVRPTDIISIRVFTNKGESILDPNGELKFGGPGGLAGITGAATQTGFTVQPDGRVRLPLLDYVTVAGLSTLQIDSLLERRFATFYKDAFVYTQVANRRVVLLGAAGGKVVPLPNEGMNLLEVLAIGGVSDARFNRIRLVRGDLKNPEVQQIDLTTITGLRKASLQMAANDVVYVEPERTFLDTTREILPLIGIFTTLFSLVAIIRTISR